MSYKIVNQAFFSDAEFRSRKKNSLDFTFDSELTRRNKEDLPLEVMVPVSTVSTVSLPKPWVGP
jgi:hypothetical protein